MRPPLRTTHTLATLPLSAPAYAEIAAALREAGYDHAFGEEGVIDMQGIGVVREPQPKVINPDSTVLQQVDGYWQKIATFLLHKLKGREAVRISTADMEATAADFAAAGGPVLLTIGQADGLVFQVIDHQAAEQLAAHDAQQRGRA